MKLLLCCSFVLLLLTAPVHSKTLYVPGNYPTIQQAIDAAVNGDTVLVDPGTYVENIDFMGKAITVASADGPTVTVIDGSQPSNPLYRSVAIFKSGEKSDSVLKGFTLTNGSGSIGYGGWFHGGGIFCYYASPTIIDNIIIKNATPAPGRGGGMNTYCCDDVTVAGCTFRENSAGYRGGGLANDQSGITLANCTFAENVAAHIGGGIYSFLSDLSVNSCTMSVNSGSDGGGMFNYSSNVTVGNSILWSNTPNEIVVYGSLNTEVLHCCIQGGWPGTGNVDADPLFVDPHDGDYHLTFPSPCKDAGCNTLPGGLPSEDFEGDPRIAYGTTDMGADEFYTHLYYTGDATPSGSVEVKFVGLPGTMPVGLFIGSGILDPSIPSMWGDWYLQFPIIGPVDLGSVPSPGGVLLISGTIPSSPPAPYSIPMQALIGAELTNLCVLEVM